MPRRVNELFESLPDEQVEPTIGIITALPKEYAAVEAVLDTKSEYTVGGRQGAGRRYLLGEVLAAHGGKHHIVLSLADKGNNSAATRAALLLEHFPNVRSIIMVGIAGGVPHHEKPSEHVRLGDVVVSNQRGVVQYDFYRETVSEKMSDYPPRPPSAVLLEGVRLLEAAELRGDRPWIKLINKGLHRLGITRPSSRMDILTSSTNPELRVRHPKDGRRKKGQPRIFLGPVASANNLLKNPITRDKLREKFGVKAVEMEGSGIADATWYHEVGYLVVRGICDYCDMNKGDKWQDYAAVVAAAYTRSLLESIEESSSLNHSDGRKRASLKKAGPAKKLIYALDLLSGWEFASTSAHPTWAIANDVMGIGNNNGTTFNASPVKPITNCRVELELRIIDDGGDASRWAGVRVRGTLYDIRLGYLIYLRRTGSVELYTAGRILAGENDPIVSDTTNLWTRLRIDVFGPHIWVFVNGRLHIHVKDATFRNKGLISLITFGTHAQFRNMKVYNLTRAPYKSK